MSDTEEPIHAGDGDGPSLLERLNFIGRRRRIPFIAQMRYTECGAACLAMVLAYHGKRVRLDEIREVMGIGRDGATAPSILHAARWFGLRARTVGFDLDGFEYLEPGTVLHWQFKHWVVFERLCRDGIDIVDPELGPRRVGFDELGTSFTGVAITLEPDDDFQPEERQDRLLWRYVRRVLEHGGAWRRVVVTSLLMQLFALAVPVLTGALVDQIIPRRDGHMLLVMGIGLFVLVLFSYMTTLIRAHILLAMRTFLDARMTTGFLNHLVALPYSFFQHVNAGDLMMRLNSNTTIREILTSGALSTVLDGALVSLYLVLILISNWTMGLVVLGFGVLQFAVLLLTRRRQVELNTTAMVTQARAQNYQVEMFAGMETLKSMGGEEQAAEKCTDHYIDVLNVALDRGRLAASIEAITHALRLATPIGILMAGALLTFDGQLSLGTMLSLSALSGAVLGPLNNIVSTGSQFQLLSTFLTRIEDVLGTPAEQERCKVMWPPRLIGHITLDDVSFRYSPSAPFVVENIALTIQPGQTVAIVGPSGAGKSTLARLLVGLYKPTSGRILYDNMDLSDLDVRGVRRQIGIVSQNPYIFGGSLRSNIALADPALPLEDVMAAARLAAIHDDIMAMPMRYDTALSDGGVSLSGGQRQRVAIARALVHRPAILLLDEATAALDTVTESRVQRALDALRCTRIIIAHRLSTIVNADVILVVDKGRIVEQGRHAELVGRHGPYAELVAAQLQSERVALNGRC